MGIEALKYGFLGLVQGLTEFLPVSSQGHLLIAYRFFGLTENLAFDTVVHLATALAAAAYFWRDLMAMLRVTSRESRKMLGLVLVATVITGVLGIGFKDFFEALFADFRYVGPFFIVTGMVILLGEWLGTRYQGLGTRGEERMNWQDACLIGLAQGAAIIPSLSRSAMTISAGLACGLERRLAARFAFIIAIPAIAGAGLLQSKAIFKAGTIGIGAWPLLLGFLAALISGWLAIKLFMTLIERTSIRVFAYYCIVLGLAVMLIGALVTPAQAAVKKPAKKVTVKKKAPAKKKVKKRRVRRPYYPLGSRPKFPVAAAEKPRPEPAPAPIIMPPVPERKPEGKAGWFAEGGLAGGALAITGGYGKQFSDKLYVSGAAGYAVGSGFGIVVLDPVRVSYDLGNYYVGAGLNYAMYSKLVKNIPGLGNISEKNLAGIELLGGLKINERLSARLGYSTCLGLRVSAGYLF
ncbi:MAG: undecaprenyl-diphosphate phosphatase [Candidatus Margulisiibacteriota bacterium]